MHNRTYTPYPSLMYIEVAGKVTTDIKPYEQDKIFSYYIEQIRQSLQRLEDVIYIQEDPQFSPENIYPIEEVKNYNLRSLGSCLNSKIATLVGVRGCNTQTHPSLNEWLTLLKQFAQHQQLLKQIVAKIKNEHAEHRTTAALGRLRDVIHIFNRNRNWENLCHHSGKGHLDFNSVNGYKLRNISEMWHLRIHTIDSDTHCKVLNKSIKDHIDMEHRLHNYQSIENEVNQKIKQHQSDSPLLKSLFPALASALQRLKEEIVAVNEHSATLLADKELSRTKTDDLLDKERMMALRLPRHQTPAGPSIQKLLIKLEEPRTAQCVFNIVHETVMGEVHRLQVVADRLDSKSEAQKEISAYHLRISSALDYLYRIIAYKYTANYSRFVDDFTDINNLLHFKYTPLVDAPPHHIDPLVSIQASIGRLSTFLSSEQTHLEDRPLPVNAHSSDSLKDMINRIKISTQQQLRYLHDTQRDTSESLYEILTNRPVSLDSHPLDSILSTLSRIDLKKAIQQRFNATTMMHQDSFSSVVIAKRICDLAEIGDLRQIQDINPDAVNINFMQDLPIVSWITKISGLTHLFQRPVSLYLGRYNALMIAVSYRQIDVVRYLLDRGGDPDLKGGRNGDLSALDCAKLHLSYLGFKEPNTEIIVLLEQHIAAKNEHTSNRVGP